MNKKHEPARAPRDFTRREAAKARAVARRKSRADKRTAARLFAFA